MIRAGLCTLTPSARQQEADWLAQVVAESKVKPVVVPGFTGVKPRPLRASAVDPETRLKRRDRASINDQRIAEIMRANVVITTESGSKPRTPRQMRTVLREHGVVVTSPQVEQLASRHGIKLLPPMNHE